jgi:hypothetical protein
LIDRVGVLLAVVLARGEDQLLDREDLVVAREVDRVAMALGSTSTTGGWLNCMPRKLRSA